MRGQQTPLSGKRNVGTTVSAPTLAPGELRGNSALTHPQLPPHPRHHQPNLVISNLRRQSVLQRPQPVDPKFPASRLDHSLLVPINPTRLKLQISSFHQIRHRVHHGRHLPPADLRNVLETVPS